MTTYEKYLLKWRTNENEKIINKIKYIDFIYYYVIIYFAWMKNDKSETNMMNYMYTNTILLFDNPGDTGQGMDINSGLGILIEERSRL